MIITNFYSNHSKFACMGPRQTSFSTNNDAHWLTKNRGEREVPQIGAVAEEFE